MTLLPYERALSTLDSTEVPHWTIDDVRALMDAARDRARRHRGGGRVSSEQRGERDALLARVLFDACLRVTEALGVTPNDLYERPGVGWFVRVIELKQGGRRSSRGRTRDAAISASAVAALQSYAYRYGVAPGERVFPITRQAAWYAMNKAADAAGIQKPPHVGAVHILRHTGTIARLRETRSPNGIQAQLGHSSMSSTLRYLKTVTREDALAAQAEVDWKL